jgi:flagellar protein FliT
MDFLPFLCLVIVGASIAHRSSLHYKQGHWQEDQDCDRLQKAGLECTNRGIGRKWPVCSVRRRKREAGRILLAKNFSKKSFENPKVPETGADNDQDTRQSGRNEHPWCTMTSNEVLAMYENIAALSGRMAIAARDGDFDGLARLETQCALQASAAKSGVPPLEGAQRLRKIDLLKQIMANDRAVRDVTEPWHGQLERAMSAH